MQYGHTTKPYYKSSKSFLDRYKNLMENTWPLRGKEFQDIVDNITLHFENEGISKARIISPVTLAKVIHKETGVDARLIRFIIRLTFTAAIELAIKGWRVRIPRAFDIFRVMKVKTAREPSGKGMTDKNGVYHPFTQLKKTIINENTIPSLPVQFKIRVRLARYLKHATTLEEVPFYEAESFRDELMTKHLELYKNKK